MSSAHLADRLEQALDSAAAQVAKETGLPLVLIAFEDTPNASLNAVRRYLASCPATPMGSTRDADGLPGLYLGASPQEWASWVPRLRGRRAASPVHRLVVDSAEFRSATNQPVTFPGAYIVTLHPTPVGEGRIGPAPARVRDAFATWLEKVGGTQSRQPMEAGTLTHIPVRLPEARPEAVLELAAFPALRSIRPVAAISFR